MVKETAPGRDAQGHANANFTAQLIKALQEATERKTQAAEPLQLADAAYDKLQYDFPLVTPEELASLIECYKQRGGYPLTPKFLAVVREGASAADPSRAAEAQQPEAANGEAGSSSSSSSARPLLSAYQQLYAVLLVKALQHALGEWDESACARFLGPLLPCLPGVDAQGAAFSGSEAALSGLEAPAAAAAAGAAGAEAGAGQEVAAVCILEEVAAQQEDSDELAYEPMDSGPSATRHSRPSPRQPHPHTGSNASGNSAATSAARWCQEQHLLPALRHLADQLSWHCASEDATWRELGLMQELAACLKAAREHQAFQELAGSVGEPVLRLVVARVGSCPGDMGGFSSVLGALGVSSSPGQAVPHAEAVRLALSAAAMLGRQLSSAPAQRKLWAEVHGSLLPLAAQQLEALQSALAKRAKQAGAQQGSSTRATSSTASAPAAPAAALVVKLEEGELLRLMAACQLLYFYVLHSPPAVQAAKLADGLLAGGLFRALVLLFVKLATLPEAESLRCALLLACVACPSLLQWAAAVPGFKAAALSLAAAAPHQQQQQQQQQPAGSEGLAGAQLAAHGALWSLLLEEGSQGGQQLVALLQTAAGSPAQVERVLGLLQVMAAAHQVSRPRYLWPAGVEAVLRQLSTAIREDSRQAVAGAEQQQQQQQQVATEAGSGSGHSGAPAAATTGVGDEGDEEDEGHALAAAAAEQEEQQKLARTAGQQAAALAARRAQQLQPVALKLLKDLLQKHSASGKHD